MLQTLKDFWHQSWTKVWGRVQVTAGVVALGWQSALPYLSNMSNDYNVKAALTALQVPAYVGLTVAVLGVVTLVARSHQN